jgi:hypothetical protein
MKQIKYQKRSSANTVATSCPPTGLCSRRRRDTARGRFAWCRRPCPAAAVVVVVVIVVVAGGVRGADD